MSINFHIKLEIKDLVHALGFANSVVEKRNVIVELSHIKLTAANDYLEIIATDMDSSLIQRIPVQVLEEGETIVPGSLLTEIIRKIPDKEIILKQEDNKDQLNIIGSKCHFNLPTLSNNKFFSLEEMNTTYSIKILCKEYARLIDYTQFAMSNEETRYNLNGVYLHAKPIVNRIYMTATDGHRLSVATKSLDTEIKEFGVILPRKTIQELLKIIKDSRNIDSVLQIDIGTNKIRFLCNNTIMVSKVIDGTFPEYDNFIPINNNNQLEINSKILADAIDRVSTVTVDKFKAIKLILNPQGLKLTAYSEVRGSAQEELEYNDSNESKLLYQGRDITIGFNPKYLMDVLAAIKHENIEIYLKDESSPTLIKIPSNPDDSFVIMPVKI